MFVGIKERSGWDLEKRETWKGWEKESKILVWDGLEMVILSSRNGKIDESSIR